MPIDRVTVAHDDRRGQWVVRADGQHIDRYRVKKTAVSNARQFAREVGANQLAVQSKLHGTWRTEAPVPR